MSAVTKELLAEIDEATQAAFDLGTRNAAKRKEGSRRKAYEKGIKEVNSLAGRDAARELTDWIIDEIEEKQALPSARQVRKRGARICRNHGEEISTGSWLGA